MKLETSAKILASVTFGVMFTMFAITAEMAYEDEVLEQRIYCEEVKRGTWPNYKKLECE